MKRFVLVDSITYFSIGDVGVLKRPLSTKVVGNVVLLFRSKTILVATKYVFPNKTKSFENIRILGDKVVCYTKINFTNFLKTFITFTTFANFFVTFTNFFTTFVNFFATFTKFFTTFTNFLSRCTRLPS